MPKGSRGLAPFSMTGKRASFRNFSTSCRDCGKLVSGAGMPLALAVRAISLLLVRRRNSSGVTLGKLKFSSSAAEFFATNTAVLSVAARSIGRPSTVRATSRKNCKDSFKGADKSQGKTFFQYREAEEGHRPLSPITYMGTPRRPRLLATPNAP